MTRLVKQSGLFLVVGIAATLVHYLIILLLVDLLGWLRPTPATVVGSVFGIATSYLGNHRLVFEAAGRHQHYAPRFVLTYLVVMGIHAGLMFLFDEVWQLPYEWGFIVATGLSAVTTFLANRYLVFRAAGALGQEGCESASDESRADSSGAFSGEHRHRANFYRVWSGKP